MMTVVVAIRNHPESKSSRRKDQKLRVLWMLKSNSSATSLPGLPGGLGNLITILELVLVELFSNDNRTAESQMFFLIKNLQRFLCVC